MKISFYTKNINNKTSFTSGIRSAHSGKEAFEYTHLAAIRLMKSKPMANFCAFLERIFSDKNTIRILKNEDGKIIGGYAYDINSYFNFNELHIRTLAIDNQPKKGINLIKKIYKDIKHIGNENKANVVTLFVEKNNKHLINRYMELGFKHSYQENPYLYKMHMPFDKFEKLTD